MLTDPSLEELLPKAGSAYELAVLVSKRASQLTDGAQPMIPDTAANSVSLACKEIMQDKVVGVKGVLGKDEYVVPITREARLAAEAEKKAKEQKENFRRDARAADLASQELEESEPLTEVVFEEEAVAVAEEIESEE